MNAEFVDTNIFVYAHDGGAGVKHQQSVALLRRIFEDGSGALSIQVLTEFYAAATRKLKMSAEEAEEVLRDLEGWTLHRSSLADLLSASSLHKRHKISWGDALIVNSAIELGCEILWSEELAAGQKYGNVMVRNPFEKNEISVDTVTRIPRWE